MPDMQMKEDEAIKRNLESLYGDADPPGKLKGSVMSGIEFINTLKDLALLYTAVPLYILSQWKLGGDDR